MDQKEERPRPQNFEVFVSGLNYDTDEEVIKKYFESKTNGEVTSVNILKGPKGFSIGRAFVRFAAEASIQAAIALAGQELDGRWLKIEKAQPRADRPQNFNRNNNNNNNYRGNNEGGYRGNNEGGYRGNNEGGYRGNNEGGYRGNNDGGYRGNNEGGYRNNNNNYRGNNNNDGQQQQQQQQQQQPYRQNNYRNNQNNADNTESTTIFIGNLSFQTNVETLREFFELCGEVKDARIPQDDEGRSRGFGYIQFADREAVEKALLKTQSKLDGRQIRVDISQPRRQR